MNKPQVNVEVVSLADLQETHEGQPENMPTREDFARWLQRQLDERGWTEAELARRSNITQTQIGRVMTGERNAGLDFYRGMARAFRLSLEDVLRVAGVLPPVSGRDQTTSSLISLLDELRPNIRSAVLRTWEADLDLVSAVTAEVDRMRRLNRLLDNLSPDQYADALRKLDELLGRADKDAGDNPGIPPAPAPQEE